MENDIKFVIPEHTGDQEDIGIGPDQDPVLGTTADQDPVLEEWVQTLVDERGVASALTEPLSPTQGDTQEVKHYLG